MMQATRTLVSRTHVCQRLIQSQQRQVVTRLLAGQQQQVQQQAQQLPRFFSAHALSTTDDSENYVKEAIKRMIEDREHDDEIKAITDKELHHRFKSFQNLYDEARSCIADCKDASGENLEEECNSAKAAVDFAFTAYLELLEDLRRASEDQLVLYNDARLQNANNLKLLRKELDKMTKMEQNA